MIMNDSVFGELEYEYGWTKDTFIQFWGKETMITLMIDGEEDGNFDEEQYLAYDAFIQNWEHVQKDMLQSIFTYYEQRRKELGYDIEVNNHYPKVETIEQLLKMIELDGIVVPYGDLCEGRDIRVTLKCTWDTENSLGVRTLDEKIIEVGYQDIAI
ncbi:DUF2004 domain-containing protein [Fictibacillus sp. 5RED26]|uniref:DUF6985 domain-containing protein n=1 Tax=Fictibacillus sp. 5RED26 TaxID=2745876 RepID=UPI0018CE0AC3|nr:DUF2004 domain-containing protein [Fictibacillus sp. 5RED26]